MMDWEVWGSLGLGTQSPDALSETSWSWNGWSWLRISQKICKIWTSGKNPSAFICESILGRGVRSRFGWFLTPTCNSICRRLYCRRGADWFRQGWQTFWGFQLQHVVPDIVTLETDWNGHPRAVITTQIAESFASGMKYFNTFGKLGFVPSGRCAGCDRRRESTRHAQETGNWHRINGLKKDFPLIGDVRGEGFFRVELFGSLPWTCSFAGWLYCGTYEIKRILLSIEGPGHNVLVQTADGVRQEGRIEFPGKPRIGSQGNLYGRSADCSMFRFGPKDRNQNHQGTDEKVSWDLGL